MRKIKNKKTENAANTILFAAIPIFAEKGFHGATTREIARKAGVSDALMYRYFPSKQKLLAAIMDFMITDGSSFIGDFEPSKSSASDFVHAIYSLMYVVHYGTKNKLVKKEDFTKIFLHSLVLDGQFSKKFLTEKISPIIDYIYSLYVRCSRNDELVAEVTPSKDKCWFAHHLSASLILYSQLVVGRPLNLSEFHSCVAFTLRGLGLKSEFIKSTGKLNE